MAQLVGSLRASASLALFVAVVLGAHASARAEQGKLLGTGGATVLEGAGGGGIVPWAALSGYGTEDENGGAISVTRVRVDDYMLDSIGASFTFRNRLELSVAHHTFEAEQFEALPVNTTINQDMIGAKVRLFGDLIYTPWPQFAFGTQVKHNSDFGLGKLVGGRRSTGVDYYLSASKLFLGRLDGYSLLLSGTLRATRANELGLLGFGGNHRSGYSFLPELSAAVLLSHSFAIGYEYRAKPENLRGLGEDPWRDVFAAYFINKRLAVVGAYANLGTIGGLEHQDGWYLSLQGSF